MTDSTVRLVALLPELLGTYGDGGNVVVLQRRLQWRGIACEVIPVSLGDSTPRSADLYVLGGGEDDAQVAALEHLRRSPILRAEEAGAHVFGVCAGLQLLGRSFLTGTGDLKEGLGLLDISTDRLATRAVGEVVATPHPDLGIPTLTGFENHAGRSVLGPGTHPLSRVVRGVGNGCPEALEGAWRGRVLATYLHGPVLARNPALADLLLERVVGAPLSPLDDRDHDRLREDLLARRRR